MAFLSPHGVFSSFALFLRPFVEGSPLASFELHGLKPEGTGPFDRARNVRSQGVHSAPPGDPETSRGNTRQGGEVGARLCGRRGCTRPAGGGSQVAAAAPRSPGRPPAPPRRSKLHPGPRPRGRAAAEEGAGAGGGSPGRCLPAPLLPLLPVPPRLQLPGHGRASSGRRQRQEAAGGPGLGVVRPQLLVPSSWGSGTGCGTPPVLPPRPVPFPGSPERAGGDAGNVSGERSPPAPARSQVGEFLLCFASLRFASLCSASLCFASLRFSSLAESRSLGAGADPAAGPIPAADAPRSTAGCPQPRGSGSDVPPAGSSQGEA